jgi:ubiquinone/menaquinone biosynthesis C-methylase UbiE
MNDMDEHFSQVAERYNVIRGTDREPVTHIRDLLSKYKHCDAVDVGCGPGRYALLLLQMIPQLYLTCLDRNPKMIAETSRLLHGTDADRFKAVIGDAADFPLDSSSVDAVFTFNAIHHFILPAFLREARRVLKKDGTIWIYSRLPSQNATSIWGKYFPDFNTVETRLYSLDSIEAAIRSIPGLALDTIKLFQFERVSSLNNLIEKARAAHYSTFSLYRKDHLEECISAFQEHVLRDFSNPDQIRWIDGNVLLTVKLAANSPVSPRPFESV